MVCTLMKSRSLLSAVDWIAVNARTGIMKGIAHLGHVWRADERMHCKRSWASRTSLTQPKEDSFVSIFARSH